MPAQKRPFEATSPPASPTPPDEAKPDDSPLGSENHSEEQAEKESDSDESSYSSGGEKDEYTVVKLAEVRKEVQCPICLGIIRKTRTVMECLHRFCRECIDKSMRLGNNECPACRTHCASRRSLRDDPNYDALIAVLYPDIDKYENEELAFNEEEKARNKQIQDLIAQTFRRQAEELGKKKTSSRTTSATYSRRHSSYRNLRGRKNHRVVEQGSDEEEEANEHDGSKDSSSADERSTEIRPKRHKRWSGIRTSQGSSADNDNGLEANRDFLGASAAFVGGTEILAWGRGGLRSNTRHGGAHGANGKLSRNNRISRLMDRLRCSNESDLMMNISLMLVSLNVESMPSLKRPHLSCSHTSLIKHLCQYVAMQTSVEASEIEMLMMKNFNPFNNPSIVNQDFGPLNPCPYELQLLDEHQTLGEIQTNFTQQNLVCAYRKKAKIEGN